MAVRERDKNTLQFIHDMKVVTSDIVSPLFYEGNLRVAQRRLQIMAENYKDIGLKRSRDGWTDKYIYYFEKPKQVRHSLLLVEFYKNIFLMNGVKILKFLKEPTWFDGLRPDGFIAFTDTRINKNYIAFLEIQICNKPLDTQKYRKLYLSEEYKKYFPTFPVLIAITNKKVQQNEDFKIIQIKEDFSNIGGIL